MPKSAPKGKDNAPKKTSRNPGSRFGLPLILAVVLLLASLSFITLGLMNRAKPPEPQQPVENKVSALVAVPEAEAPRTEPVPVPAAEGPPAASLAPEASRPAETPSPVPPGEATANFESIPLAPPAPGPATIGGSPIIPELAMNAPQAPAPAPAVPPAEQDRTASPAAPPAPETKTAAVVAPPPVWQTLNENWDQVKAGEASGIEAPDAGGADWKQLNVGQTETVRENVPLPLTPKARPETAKAAETPAAKPSSETRTASKTASKAPAKTKTASRPAPAGSSASKPPRLAVFNESGRPGQAEIYRDVLKAMGYQVAQTGDRVPQPGPTTVLYGPGLRETALKLIQRIPGQRTMAPLEGSSSFDLVLLVR